MPDDKRLESEDSVAKENNFLIKYTFLLFWRKKDIWE